MKQLESAYSIHKFVHFSFALALGLILTEVFFLALFYEGGGYSALRNSAMPTLFAIGYMPSAIKVIWIVMFFILIKNSNLFFQKSYNHTHKKKTIHIVINLLSFFILIIIFMINDNNEFLAYFSTFLLLTHLVSSLGILFRWNDLLTIIYKNKILILFLIPLAIVIRIYWYQIFFGITNELLWTDFLIHPTLNLTTFFSELLNQKITINSIGPDGPLFGTEKFQVLILAGCSGYEGIIIEISLLTFYIINIRDSLRLPNALLILPLAGMAMFCLNAMRIAVLILIGTVW